MAWTAKNGIDLNKGEISVAGTASQEMRVQAQRISFKIKSIVT